MSQEIEYTYVSGKVTYFLVRSSIGQIWNGSAFESCLIL